MRHDVEYHERVRLTVDQLLKVESLLLEPSPIIEAYERWKQDSLLNAGEPAALCGVIDLSYENPSNYMIDKHPNISIKQLAGLRLAEHPLPNHARMCGMEYLNAKETGQPVCHYVNQIVGGWEREYLRIILLDTGTACAGYTVRYLKPPQRVGPARLEAAT